MDGSDLAEEKVKKALEMDSFVKSRELAKKQRLREDIVGQVENYKQRLHKMEKAEREEDKKQLAFAKDLARLDRLKQLENKKKQREMNARTWIAQANAKYQRREIDALFC